MMSRNFLALFGIFAIVIASIESFQIRSAAKVENIERAKGNWETERNLDFRAVVCSECPQRLKPPPQCDSCSEDADCESEHVCCPFITLTTTPSVCSADRNKDCRLANTINIDFLRSVCSCVRQVKCCVKLTTTPTTTAATTVYTTEDQSTSTENSTSVATESTTVASTSEATESTTETSTSEATESTTEASISEATEPSTEESTAASSEPSTVPSSEATSVAASEATTQV